MYSAFSMRQFDYIIGVLNGFITELAILAGFDLQCDAKRNLSQLVL
jgi:hypothetical protein